MTEHGGFRRAVRKQTIPCADKQFFQIDTGWTDGGAAITAGADIQPLLHAFYDLGVVLFVGGKSFQILNLLRWQNEIILKFFIEHV